MSLKRNIVLHRDVKKAPAAKTAKAPTVLSAKTAAAAAPIKADIERHPREALGMDVYKPANKNPSRTSIPLQQFNTEPGLVLSDRTLRLGGHLKSYYGNKPFKRLDLDAAVLKMLVRRGNVQPISGGDADPQATFRFTNRPLGG